MYRHRREHEISPECVRPCTAQIVSPSKQACSATCANVLWFVLRLNMVLRRYGFIVTAPQSNYFVSNMGIACKTNGNVPVISHLNRRDRRHLPKSLDHCRIRLHRYLMHYKHICCETVNNSVSSAFRLKKERRSASPSPKPKFHFLEIVLFDSNATIFKKK